MAPPSVPLASPLTRPLPPPPPQVNEKVPTISIDKTDGLQMYLSKDSLDVVLVTSKSSEMNVLVPKGDGDYVSVQRDAGGVTSLSPPRPALVQ